MTMLAFAESIQLVPDGTIVLHIAIIITMVFVLNKLLFKPINTILEERESRTRGRSGEARETIRRVEESLANYTQMSARSMLKERKSNMRYFEASRLPTITDSHIVLCSVSYAFKNSPAR